MSSSVQQEQGQRYSSAKNTVGILPTPLETWEQQQRSSKGLNEVRRILPLPGGHRKEPQESDVAKNVRRLLARNPQKNSSNMINSHLNGDNPDSRRNASYVLDNGNSDSNASDDQFSSALPGDSYPETEGHLFVANEDENEEEEEALLQKLNQSQARMEQIKRMLVNQRGFIVQALRQMAEGNASRMALTSHSSCQSCQPRSDFNNEERDRTLGATVKVDPVVLHSSKLNSNGNEPTTINSENHTNSKLCPMCEVVFPSDISQDEFEQHVIEHFNYEEPDTLKYIGP